MKWLDYYRMRFVFVGVVSCSIFALPKLLAGQATEASGNDRLYSEVIIMIAGQEHRYQPRPELGYVVVAQDDSGAIASIYRDLSLFTQNEIKSVGGRGRQGLWIVESRQSAAQSKAVIKTLSAQRQVQYVAPLFSCNGETEAVIPEIVVRVTAGTQSRELEQICKMLNLHIKRRMMFTQQEYLIGVSGENADAVLAALIELNQIESVEWAAPNVITQRRRPERPVSEIVNSGAGVSLYNAQQNPRTTGFMPNDEYFPMQWHLHNTGQFGGTPGADINAPEAWEITTGDPNIVICVGDVGVDLDHPDLVNNLVPGYDFYENDDLPEPAVGIPSEAHGTNSAGVIAAEGNNNIGVVGVAWKCKVMPIREGTWTIWVSMAKLAEAVRWAAVNGADVMNYSWGFTNPRPIIHSAIVDITKPGGIGRDGKGCVVLAPAGNDGSPRLKYAAAYPEVVGVGATDCNDARWSYSDYGPELDIVAPGGERWYYAPGGKAWPKEGNAIWTTDIAGPPGMSSHAKSPLPDIQDYALFGGTCSACAVAAGVAALILSVEPELTNEEVRHFLCRSAKDLGDPGRDDYYGWGRVGARAALDMVLAKRADLNNDWKVDLEDLLVLIEFWGATETSVDIAPVTGRDGIVDEQDLDLMMRYWQTEIPELGLVAHWKLDETEGSTAKDSIADNDGALFGEPLWQPDGGIVAGAIQFDGIDDYVSTDPVLNSVDGYAITEIKGSGRSAPGPLLSEAIITDGNWHRIGLVWDGSYRHLYVDGAEVATDAAPLSALEGSDGGLYFGVGSTLAPGTYFSGLIDDVRIYNRAVKP